MDRATAAERVLRLVMPAERAAALVGDELETSPEAGRTGFWASMLWLLVVFSWRTVLGLVAAPFVAALCTFWPWALIVGPVVRSHMETGRMQDIAPQMRWEGYLAGAAIILTGQAVFALIRYGVRDALARVSLLCGLAATAISCLMWFPHTGPVCAVMLAGLVISQGATQERRRALGVAAMVFVMCWCAGRMLLASLSHDPVHKWPLMLMMVLVPLMGAATTGLLHHRLLEAGDVLSA